MRATKGNKEYIIGESQMKGYQDCGFDILDECGDMIACGRGKTVPYEDYRKAVQENARLQERIAELEAGHEVSAEGPEKTAKQGTKKAGE